MFKSVSTFLLKGHTRNNTKIISRWCKSVAEIEPVSDVVLGESEREQRSVEEIERIRDKSRLPDSIKQRYVRKVFFTPPYDFSYTLEKLRSSYGTYGETSGLNPGLCWPTPEELELKLEYEALANRPFQEMVTSIKKRKSAEANARLRKEEEVEKNMRKLVKLNQEFKERNELKEQAAIAQRLKKERIVNEIREQLGYNVDVRDPRFREILVRREEELKKAAKEAKKKKAKDNKIEYLHKLAETGEMRREAPQKNEEQ